MALGRPPPVAQRSASATASRQSWGGGGGAAGRERGRRLVRVEGWSNTGWLNPRAHHPSAANSEVPLECLYQKEGPHLKKERAVTLEPLTARGTDDPQGI